jgi:RNA polymerase sigma-70 factor (ECF subfamily)
VFDNFSATLAAAQSGDDRAVAELWASLNHRVVRFLRVRAGDASEDIASETWLTVARDLHRFSGNEIEFRAWLFTIARSRLFDWQRREKRRPSSATDPIELVEARVASDDPADDAIEILDTERALKIICELPPDQAEVVLLRVLAGLDVARVAEIVGKRPGSVRMLQHRGLQRLREMVIPEDRDQRGVTR